ncbi:hypothetical protein NPIL_648021 [Nephila pilipes]|uniref:Uncharacterized protein n=1 Tax=Nephila pilipes TaxID=299642 RepID=A0A8X6R411_NEPPI|nr:hypothetical protein NPIL_648021 [Nephila pilipes]
MGSAPLQVCYGGTGTFFSNIRYHLELLFTIPYVTLNRQQVHCLSEKVTNFSNLEPRKRSTSIDQWVGKQEVVRMEHLRHARRISAMANVNRTEPFRCPSAGRPRTGCVSRWC